MPMGREDILHGEKSTNQEIGCWEKYYLCRRFLLDKYTIYHSACKRRGSPLLTVIIDQKTIKEAEEKVTQRTLEATKCHVNVNSHN